MSHGRHTAFEARASSVAPRGRIAERSFEANERSFEANE
jgi:hypothetical protein